MTQARPRIAILGGTGDLGTGLARRWIKSGYQVIIGSRTKDKADAAAADLNSRLGTSAARGDVNLEAARDGELVVLTIPFASHDALVDEIADAVEGKVVVDATVPLVPPKVRTVTVPQGGSVAKTTQQRLGDKVRVVSAFQTVAAAHLADLDHRLDSDVLVCGNDPEARRQVIELAEAAGLHGWHAGRIDNSIVSEGMTSILIFMNSHYKIDGAGLRITGQPHRES